MRKNDLDVSFEAVHLMMTVRTLPSTCALRSLITLALLFVSLNAVAQQRTTVKRGARTRSASSAKSFSVRTEPNASVWLDEVRRGTTDASGNLTLKNVSPGRHTLRVRARGFAERTLLLLPAQRRVINIKLTRTTDAAELAFQEAEETRERATTDEARQTAVELYRRALALRPRFAQARVGLARALFDTNHYAAALDEIAAAHRIRPIYPEASAIEGRILRATADADAAIEAYRRAIREGRGFQPEAHTGLGVIYEEKGQYEEAAAAFRKAIAQLSDSEPALYQLLGAIYERQEKYKEAVTAYEKYLELAPNGSLAPAIRSTIDQLRRQAAGEILTP